MDERTNILQYIVWNNEVYVHKEETMEELLLEGLSRVTDNTTSVDDTDVQPEQNQNTVQITEKVENIKIDKKPSDNVKKKKKLHYTQEYKVRFGTNYSITGGRLINEKKKPSGFEIGTNEYQKYRRNSCEDTEDKHNNER
jgi:hypothetical protein